MSRVSTRIVRYFGDKKHFDVIDYNGMSKNTCVGHLLARSPGSSNSWVHTGDKVRLTRGRFSVLEES